MPERKAVLLFGDSIRVGYAETVKETLSDIADVFYPLGNGRNTQYLMTGLYTWSSLCNPEAVDLIHFNCPLEPRPPAPDPNPRLCRKPPADRVGNAEALSPCEDHLCRLHSHVPRKGRPPEPPHE